jgi:hypothetical protein
MTRAPVLEMWGRRAPVLQRRPRVSQRPRRAGQRHPRVNRQPRRVSQRHPPVNQQPPRANHRPRRANHRRPQANHRRRHQPRRRPRRPRAPPGTDLRPEGAANGGFAAAYATTLSHPIEIIAWVPLPGSFRRVNPCAPPPEELRKRMRPRARRNFPGLRPVDEGFNR